MADRVRTIAASGSHEIVIKKSRFICTVERISSEDEGKAFIHRLRKEYWDANHNCSAWVIGPHGELQRSNDDGEPSGTAGLPMLNVLNQQRLTDVVAVVTRYFGGTLLGAGGLIRAYGQAVTETIDEVGIVERKSLLVVLISAPHDLAGKLEYALHGTTYHLAGIDYGEAVTYELHIDPEELDSLTNWLGEATSGRCQPEVAGEQIVEVPV